MRLFKRRRFTEGVYVNVRTTEMDFFCFLKLPQFFLDNHIYEIDGGWSHGVGQYCGFHSKENAKRIDRYLDQKAKEWKKLKAEQPTETLRYATTYKQT